MAKSFGIHTSWMELMGAEVVSNRIIVGSASGPPRKAMQTSRGSGSSSLVLASLIMERVLFSKLTLLSIVWVNHLSILDLEQLPSV